MERAIGPEEVAEQLRLLEWKRVGRVARAALGREDVEVVRWGWEPLRVSLGIATGGLFRVHGTAREAGGAGVVGSPEVRPEVPWSAVFKVVRPPRGTRHDAFGRDPDYLGYWKREPLAYGSDLLRGLPELGAGLAAPRCLWIDEAGSGDEGGSGGEEVWLWLEEVVDHHGGWWPVERTLLATRHVGMFGGAFVERAPRLAADLPWLGQGYLRQRVERATDELPLFADKATWEDDRIRAYFEPGTGERLRAAWSRRYELLDVLDGLPRTLCHGDCHRGNLFAVGVPADRQGDDVTVAIDWGTLGLGPVGADLAELALSRSVAGDLVEQGGHQLSERLLQEYVQGLRVVNTDSSAAHAGHMGFAATALLVGTSRLHWTLERALADKRDAASKERVGGVDVAGGTVTSAPGHAVEAKVADTLHRWGALTRMFLDLAVRWGI